MYFKPGALLAMKSRLSRTCCAVTRGPKQYQEHQPVGGDLNRNARRFGWLAFNDRASSSSNFARSDPERKVNSSISQLSPGFNSSPSVSTTTCNEFGRR